MKPKFGIFTATVAALLIACTDNALAPYPPNLNARTQSSEQAMPWGPETPNFNLEVILRGEDKSKGLVKFRQPNDVDKIIYLDVSVRGLAPNTHYSLQRAVDTNLDGICTGTAWLTLGKGLVAEDIVTDANGTGKAALFRDVSSLATGATFDIHFQIVETGTTNIVLTSDCYQYSISQ